jgi:hypothetical protein
MTAGAGTPCIYRREIAVHYLRGWFAIDFVSCLPIQYISKAIEGGGSSVDLSFMKAFRLLRMSKMLRLARLKRIMIKYENLEAVQNYGGVWVK